MHKHKNSLFKHIDKPFLIYILINNCSFSYQLFPWSQFQRYWLLWINHHWLTVTASLAQVYVGNCAADIKQPANVLLTSLCLTGHQNTFYTLPAPILVRGRTSNPSPCHSNYSHQSNHRWELTHLWFIIYIQIGSAVSSSIKMHK